MSYEMCLEKAGAKVIAFEMFGSYQGDWYAYVEYKGEKGWVNGSFGSCSGCDAFEAEFRDAYWWDEDDNQESQENINKRYALFGESYLGSILPTDTQISILHNQLGEPEDWDYEDTMQIVNFVKKVSKENE